MSDVSLNESALARQSESCLIEEWLLVPDFPIYRVSNTGRVQNCRSRKNSRRKKVWRDMKSTPTKSGHRLIRLQYQGRKLLDYVHRLVRQLFVGPCPEGMEACHGDGNPGNNFVTNLRWDTRKNNLADRLNHGTLNCGEKCGTAKLTDDKVRLIRVLKSRGVGSRTLASRFEVDYTQINNIVTRRRWAYLDAGLSVRARAVQVKELLTIYAKGAG